MTSGVNGPSTSDSGGAGVPGGAVGAGVGGGPAGWCTPPAGASARRWRERLGSAWVVLSGGTPSWPSGTARSDQNVARPRAAVTVPGTRAPAKPQGSLFPPDVRRSLLFLAIAADSGQQGGRNDNRRNGA